MPVAGAV